MKNIYTTNKEEMVCNCPIWKNQKIDPKFRTCKHLSNNELLNPPKLTLFSNNLKNIDKINHWLWSEKYDGVRAYWNGSELLSRGGIKINTPFNLPKDIKLDGELWCGYGKSSKVKQCLYIKQDHDLWNNIEYMVFDIDESNIDFNTRYNMLKNIPKEKYDINVVNYSKVISKRNLKYNLSEIINKCGEGIVCRNPNAFYRSGRSINTGIKMKEILYGRATLTDNKFIELDKNGLKTNITFKIGYKNKFSLKEGDTVEFRYNNRTSRGKPKYPVLCKNMNT